MSSQLQSAAGSKAPVVLITGAGGQGIGFSSAVKFAKMGYRVVATDISPLQATVDAVAAVGQLPCYPLYMDVCSSDSVNQAVQKIVSDLGQINVLVNNAANSLGTDIMKLDEETWDNNVTLALKSVYLVTKACLPHLISASSSSPNAPSASIINIVSVNGQTGFGEEAYSAAKAGVINLTQNLAVRYGPQNIRANAVSPGTIMTQAWQARIDKDPQTMEKLKKYYPLGRIGRGEDVAGAVYFLASPEASWVTGTTLNVDGGLMAGSSMLQKDLVP